MGHLRRGTATRMEKADGGVFRGECVIAQKWDKGDCNTKIIGARYYGDSFLAVGPAGRPRRRPSRSPRATAAATAPTPRAPRPATRSTDVTTEGRKFGTVMRHGPRGPAGRLQGVLGGRRPRQQRLQQHRLGRGHRPGRARRRRRHQLLGRRRRQPDARRGRARLRGRGRGRHLRVGLRRQLRPGCLHARPPGAVADHGRRVDARTTSRTPSCSATGKKLVGASISTKPVKKTRVVDSAKAAAAGSAAGDADLCGPELAGPRRR